MGRRLPWGRVVGNGFWSGLLGYLNYVIGAADRAWRGSAVGFAEAHLRSGEAGRKMGTGWFAGLRGDVEVLDVGTGLVALHRDFGHLKGHEGEGDEHAGAGAEQHVVDTAGFEDEHGEQKGCEDIERSDTEGPYGAEEVVGLGFVLEGRGRGWHGGMLASTREFAMPKVRRDESVF